MDRRETRERLGREEETAPVGRSIGGSAVARIDGRMPEAGDPHLKTISLEIHVYGRRAWERDGGTRVGIRNRRVHIDH